MPSPWASPSSRSRGRRPPRRWNPRTRASCTSGRAWPSLAWRLTVGTVIGWLLAEGEPVPEAPPDPAANAARRAGLATGRGAVRSATRRRCQGAGRQGGRGSPRRAVRQPDRLQPQGPTSRAGTRRRLAAGLRIRQGGSYPRARRPRAGGTPGRGRRCAGRRGTAARPRHVGTGRDGAVERRAAPGGRAPDHRGADRADGHAARHSRRHPPGERCASATHPAHGRPAAR